MTIRIITLTKNMAMHEINMDVAINGGFVRFNTPAANNVPNEAAVKLAQKSPLPVCLFIAKNVESKIIINRGNNTHITINCIIVFA